MVEYIELFVGFDDLKDSYAVAVAESSPKGEVRSCGKVGSDAASVRQLARKLERPDVRLRFCYQAWPTGTAHHGRCRL